MIRLSIFSNCTASLVYLQAFIHGIVLWSLLYYGPFFFQGVRGFSPTLSGVGMFPETFTIAPVAAVVGVLVSIMGTYQWALWVGWALTCIGFGLLYIEDGNTPNVIWISLNIVPGLGMGILFTSMIMAVLAASKPVDVAYAASFFTFTRTFGNCIGVAVGGAIFQNQVKHNLKAYPLLASLADQYSEDSAALIEIIKIMPKSQMKDQLIQSYADSLNVVWVTMSALSGLAFFCNFGIKAYTLKQALVTEHGFLQPRKTKDIEAQPPDNNTGVISLDSVLEKGNIKSVPSYSVSSIDVVTANHCVRDEEKYQEINQLAMVAEGKESPCNKDVKRDDDSNDCIEIKVEKSLHRKPSNVDKAPSETDK